MLQIMPKFRAFAINFAVQKAKSTLGMCTKHFRTNNARHHPQQVGLGAPGVHELPILKNVSKNP